MSTASLLVSSRDRTGIVAALSDLIFRQNGNIIDADQHSEKANGMFFMRLVWDLEHYALDAAGTENALRRLAANFDNQMRWRLWYAPPPARLAVLCSKTPHCLYDLLLREQMGELEGEIALIVSNHQSLRVAAAHFNKPFFYVPVTAATRAAAEAEQLRLLREWRIDTVVLARYMQILSPRFIEEFPAEIINIHHSFLPAFVGADPYRQAKERGVKIIGATAHYVTTELDQGAIIEQDVTRVTHRDGVEDLTRKGRDLERQVLSRALRAHLQHRVLVHQNRTMVFS
jgi:formyltetrahydrofolate deformylase